MDTSSGTTQPQQAANFPHGVPVASDASMKDWMGYVYQQKPLPTDFTGVPVALYVLDANGNYRSIGTATTDENGFYSLTWKPEIPGDFRVYAYFGGTNGYWPSNVETAFTVLPQSAPPVEQPQPPPSMTDTYIVYAVIAIIAAIAVVGALILFVLRKRP